MNIKAKKQAKVQNSSINVLSAEELSGKVKAIKKELKSYTWRDLETNGKFTKNDKLSFIYDEMLIVGCDIGSVIYQIKVCPYLEADKVVNYTQCGSNKQRDI